MAMGNFFTRTSLFGRVSGTIPAMFFQEKKHSFQTFSAHFLMFQAFRLQKKNIAVKSVNLGGQTCLQVGKFFGRKGWFVGAHLAFDHNSGTYFGTRLPAF